VIRLFLFKSTTIESVEAARLVSARKLGILFEIEACEKFYRGRPAGSALWVHIIDIGVGVYALLSRVLTSEDKILSITMRSDRYRRLQRNSFRMGTRPNDELLSMMVKTAIHEGPDTIQTKEEAGKWSKKIRKCNVPCVVIQLQVNSSGIFVRVAA
jgi:hypothetical protein